MAQAIAETVFDILYLGFALITGLTMLTKGKSRIVKMAGWMTALLGQGIPFIWYRVPTHFGQQGWKQMQPHWGLGNLLRLSR